MHQHAYDSCQGPSLTVHCACAQASAVAGKASLVLVARDITHGGKHGAMSITEATQCALSRCTWDCCDVPF